MQHPLSIQVLYHFENMQSQYQMLQQRPRQLQVKSSMLILGIIKIDKMYSNSDMIGILESMFPCFNGIIRLSIK